MRHASFAGISAMCLRVVLLLWIVTVLLLPLGEVSGAPTLTSSTGRPSRGDRTVPPPGSFDSDIFFFPDDGTDESIGGRARREAPVAPEDPSVEDSELASSSHRSSRGANEPLFDNSFRGTSDAWTDSREMHETDSDNDYYHFFYYDSFVEGVTTREDMEEYSQYGAPVDLEESDDDHDDGEIMELMNVKARQKLTS